MRGVILDADTLGPDIDMSPLLKRLPHWQQFASTAADQTRERIRSAQVLVTNKVIIDAALMQSAPELKLICVAATGTNNIDLEAAARLGIVVTNVPGYSGNAVTQHTLALILTLATRMTDYQQAVRQGDWSRSPHFCLQDFPITELAGKTLGIIGYGAIGKAVTVCARALGMRVLISQRPGQAGSITDAQTGIADGQPGDRTPFAEVLANADILSLHCPLTPTTQHLLNSQTLAQMKPGSWLINTARGGLIDEPALAHALRHGTLGAAALDCLSIEPPPPEHPLLASDIPNLLLTPHIAWASDQARQRLVQALGENIEAFLQGEIRNQV